MRIEIAGDEVNYSDEFGNVRTCQLGSVQGFNLLSKLWIRSGWDTKYVYGFSWMGRPIIQLPEDIVRVQETIYATRPDFVIETGVAHGGSLILYASILKCMGQGKVIGVDIEIRPDNRRAIEAHELSSIIDLVEGSSIEDDVIRRVANLAGPNGHGLVILDSNHSSAHVLEELRLYSPFVGIGSYIIACDGIMQDVVGAPRTSPSWATDNPQTAVFEFLAENEDYVLDEPAFPFNEGLVTERVTYWPNAYIKRIR